MYVSSSLRAPHLVQHGTVLERAGVSDVVQQTDDVAVGGDLRADQRPRLHAHLTQLKHNRHLWL